MPKRKRSVAEREAELKFFRIQERGNNITKIVRDLIKYGTIGAIFISGFYFYFQSTIILAGKETKADISLSAILSVLLSNQSWSNNFLLGTTLLSLLFGISGIVYGLREAKLRKDVIEKFAPFQEAAEKKIDPFRSSSKLLPRGETRPEDI